MNQGPDWQVPGYEDVQELGRGGFGRVVLARRLADGAPVAVKYLADRLVGDAGFRAEFQQEARMLAGLRSPHTVRLYEYVEAGGDPVSGAAIVMEYVPGASLRKLLASAGGVPMPPQAALGILKGSLLGLGAAHGLGVVHRDYKPENVLVRPEGASVLADFGIAVRSGDRAAAVVGTPPYMAPEQFAGMSPSPAADVYAATAVFFECVTGRRPIDVDSRDLDSWARAHRGERVPVEMAPPPVRALIARGLSKDPLKRPAQAFAFAAELERAAVQGYGPDWERTGLRVLVGALSGLAATGVLLSLVPGLLGSGVPLPLPVAPLPAPVPTPLPSPTMGPPASPLPSPTPGMPAGPPGLGAPPSPGYPSAPQSPYPRPRVPRHHPWRHLQAKVGTAKAVATVTAGVVVAAGGTTAAVLTSTHKAPKPVVAVPTTSAGSPTRSTPAAGAPATSASVLTLGVFTGNWVAHSSGLIINPDGTFTLSWRTYGNPDRQATGTGRITTATATEAAGEITQSDYTKGDGAIPLGAAHFAFSPTDDTVKIQMNGDKAWYTFCGERATPGFCGA